MPIPTVDDLILPVLRRSDEQTWEMHELTDLIAAEVGLTDSERAQLLPTGGTVFGTRIGWAKTHLKKALLVEQPKRGHMQITARGRELLAEQPVKIDGKLLRRYPEYVAFLSGTTSARTGDALFAPSITAEAPSATPEEQIESAFSTLDAALAEALLDRVREASPTFFEQLIITLLLKMGYGGSQKDAGERIGRPGDGGVDGVIREDKLGLDQIYLQAKRYKAGNNISGDTVQAFIGALHVRGVHKGVLITTSDFTPAASRAAERSGNLRLVLINGTQLARLMIDNDVGVRVKRSFQIKSVDAGYFDNTDLE